MGEELSPIALASVEDVKGYVDLDEIPGDVDEVVTRLINAASEAIALVAGREIRPADPSPHERIFYVRPGHYGATRLGRNLRIGDLAELDAIGVDDSTLSPTDLGYVVALPTPRVYPWQPYTRLRFNGGLLPGTKIAVTGTWGFPQVPEKLRQATIESVDYWVSRDLARYSETFAEENPDRPTRPGADDLPSSAWRSAIRFHLHGIV